MASENYCEVRTTQGIFRDWSMVSVSWGIETDWVRQFQFQLAEPDDRMRVLRPGARCDIALAGQVAVSQGVVRVRQVGFDARRHGIQVAGLGRPGVLTQSSFEPKQGVFRGYSFESIAKSVLQRYGLKFRLDSVPDAASIPYRGVAVMHGETPFSFLERLARQRGIWLRTEADGTVVGGVPEGGSTVTLEEGVNILGGTLYEEDPGVGEIVFRSQQPGSDSLFGKPASEISAETKIGSGTGRRIGLAEEPAGQRELQARADMEAAATLAENLRVVITHQGWLKPGTGALWNLLDPVTVKSRTLFGSDNAVSLRAWSVTCSQSSDAPGTTTTVEMVSSALFGQRYPDATKSDDFYSPKASPAVPEAET